MLIAYDIEYSIHGLSKTLDGPANVNMGLQSRLLLTQVLRSASIDQANQELAGGKVFPYCGVVFWYHTRSLESGTQLTEKRSYVLRTSLSPPPQIADLKLTNLADFHIAISILGYDEKLYQTTRDRERTARNSDSPKAQGFCRSY